MKKCNFCGKFVEEWLNYCSWACHVDEAKKNGGKVITPNDLPIRCVRWDNTMLEHEHGDHPDYKFPVSIEWVGEGDADWVEDMDGNRVEVDYDFNHQTHALIYSDGNVALTTYECCYAIWYLGDGVLLGGSLWKKGWRLTEESLKKIREQYPEHVSD